MIQQFMVKILYKSEIKLFFHPWNNLKHVFKEKNHHELFITQLKSDDAMSFGKCYF